MLHARSKSSVPQSATLDDIAARVGVSRYTVARILSGETRGCWSSTAERAERIRAVAAELGYRANSAARATATGRFGAAALLLPSGGGDWTPPGMLRGITARLSAAGLHLAIAVLPDEQLADPALAPKLLAELSVDGVLINHIQRLPAGIADLVGGRGPTPVWLNSRQPHDCLRPDDRSAGVDCARRLIAAGHRRIAWLPPSLGGPRLAWGEGARIAGWQRGPDRHCSEADRHAGWSAALSDAGLAAPPATAEHHASPQEAIAEFTVLLRRADRPTAAVAYRSTEALLLLRAAERLGLRVPEDLSLAVITWGDDIGYAVPLSGHFFPASTFGEQAADLLLARLARPRRRLPVTLFHGCWLDAGSIAPPPETP